MAKSNSFTKRYAWSITTFAPLLPNMIGSLFNVWYNVTNIQPLLSPSQLTRFMGAVTNYNAIIYPVLIVWYVWWMLPIRETYRRLRAHQTVEESRVARDRRKVINSPWAIVAIGCVGWFLCIPVFLLNLYLRSEPVHPHLVVHLPISFIIAGMIAVSQSLFVSELCSLRLLHPTFFPTGGASRVVGGRSITIASKGLVWAVSAVVCPVISLLLLIVAPQNVEWIGLFAISVSAVAIAFGLLSAWLMAELITEPVNCLRAAAEQIADGNLNARVDLSRADDFGPLIDQFNQMAGGLREKAHLQETFGQHVGETAAREILKQQHGELGEERRITVMFADLRNFTSYSSELPPAEVVEMLNLFFTESVEIVERHGGMVNKFLGDGLMALFGATTAESNHADDAVAAGVEIVACMQRVNDELRCRATSAESTAEVAVGIGVHTGDAVVGSIGSARRLEYTAIGDTVNVASRIESLSKRFGVSLLISQATQDARSVKEDARKLPPQRVKGKSEAIIVFAIDSLV